MTRIGLQLAVAALAVSAALTQVAVAQEADTGATLREILVKAEACKIEFGADWEPIVNDAMTNLEDFMTEDNPDTSKVDLDVALTEALADGKELPVTEELRSYCNTVIASGG